MEAQTDCGSQAREWKGIILAGGSGSRLYPLTLAVSKQLMPVNDKPMLYYSLSVLLLAGIREFLIITTPKDLPCFESLLGDGSHLGISLSYMPQPKPEGIAQAFLLGKDFIGDSNVAMILGDNIFFGHGLATHLQSAINAPEVATVFGYHVTDPERYGVVSFDKDRNVLDIEEKPKHPKSNYAVTGLYFYPSSVVEIAEGLRPSARGELEITDVNIAYLEHGQLQVELMGRGIAWLDTGTHTSLLQAGNFVHTVESRQGLKIGCIEEIAFRMGYISSDDVKRLAAPLRKTGYGQYLLDMVKDS